METRYDNSGRVQPTAFGNLLHPGICLLCRRPGRSSDEIFANLGVELEEYGIAYLCLECCAEIADFICFKNPEEYREMRSSYLDLVIERNVLLAQLQEAKGLLNARIDSAGYSEPSSDGNDDLSIPEALSTADEIDRILNENKSDAA